MSGRADRRTMIGGLAGCLAAGAVGAVAGSGTARAAARAAEAQIDDRRILEIAAQFEALERRRTALLPGGGTPLTATADDAMTAIETHQDELASELVTLAASGPQACAAVAACLSLYLGEKLPDPADTCIRIGPALSGWLAANLKRSARRAV